VTSFGIIVQSRFTERCRSGCQPEADPRQPFKTHEAGWRLRRKLARPLWCSMFYIYVLWSDTLKKRYVGSSQDPSTRLKQHNAGQGRFTKRGIPWVLLHTEAFENRTEALRREHFLKSGAGRSWLNSKFPQSRV
jgi:putative endonuclease